MKQVMNNKGLIIFIIGGILLLIGMVGEIIQWFDYQKRVDSGNARWKQVEERIINIEECCGCDGRDSENSF